MNVQDIDEKTLLQALDKIAFQIGDKLDLARPAWGPSKHYTNWASEVNFPCKRSLTYARLNWKEKRPMDLTGRYRVEEGIEQEKQVKKHFSDIGYEVDLGQQHWDWEKYQISGRIDGVIRANIEIPMVKENGILVPEDGIIPMQEFPLVIPIEVKSVNPRYWDSIRTIGQINCHVKWWINKITSQLNIYLLMMGLPGGLLILKTYGKRPRILPMVLDWDLGEKNLQTAEIVNSHVVGNSLPPRIIYISDVCDLCGFNHVCKPVKFTEFVDASSVPPETLDEMDRFCRLQAQMDELKPDYNALQKKLIGDKKKPGIFRGKTAVFEGYEITSRVGKTTSTSIRKSV